MTPPSAAGSFSTRKARCNKCHALTDTKRDVTNFIDNDFHNIGIGIIRHNVVALARKAEQLLDSGDTAAIDRAAIQTDMSALGRFLITKKEADTASFKTPNLRNVLVTGPYFHDGSQETLWDVIDHYNKGDGLKNPYLDEDIQPLALTEDEIDDLVAFLASLTSPDYKELGAQGAGTTARPLPDEPTPARHGESLRPETAQAEAASPMTTKLGQGRRAPDSSARGPHSASSPDRHASPPIISSRAQGEAWGILMRRKRMIRLPSTTNIPAPSIKGRLPPTNTKHRGISVPPPSVSTPRHQSCSRV